MDWLEEQLGEYEDDYLIIDCPGTSDVRVSVTLFFFFFWLIVVARRVRLDPSVTFSDATHVFLQVR
jgi:hypothetical protein